jgi:hypothetical protein
MPCWLSQGRESEQNVSIESSWKVKDLLNVHGVVIQSFGNNQLVTRSKTKETRGIEIGLGKGGNVESS